MNKSDRICQVIVAVAGRPTKIEKENSWNVFSEESLRNIAKNDSKRFTFKDGKLFMTTVVDKNYIKDFENTNISMGCSKECDDLSR